LIRNSCSTGWGDKRLRLAPYEYVLKGLNEDWWSFLKNEWIDTGNFGKAERRLRRRGIDSASRGSSSSYVKIS
jgi:C1A family cysteine protease